ncbi:hypothetical protein MPVG_00224 [Micromonas pusilla virus 12T]|uniref:hypothetical protein n=1 Tax=Micromonas pusilla virus 12T TaxID=755272 RepID=UPI0002C10D84|nr:hypothetical protein MPVG_00224 [Micromonas pusilla virus 12T]AGH31043.1 hypothetical protein MPVG_00224 [Micromonas pusilla virus 12T]
MPTSSGAAVSLHAIGKQESYIHSENLDQSIFNYNPKTHSHFTKFHRTTVVNKSPTSPTWPFNERIKVTFNPQNMGDLLSNMYIMINLPGLTNDKNYSDQVGRHLIKSVTMRVDEIEVEKIFDDWMVIHDELYLEVSEKVANRFILNRMLGFDTSSAQRAYASLDSEVIIPLPFFFSRKYSSDEYLSNEPNRPFFPLCAVHKQKIEFEFEFHPQNFFTNSVDTIQLDNFKIITEEFTIDPVERLYLKNKEYTMITDLVKKHPTIETLPGVDTVQTNLVPNSRVKSIHWFLRNSRFEDTSVSALPVEFDTYKIYVRDIASGTGVNQFTLKNLSFFTALTQRGVTTFSRVNFSGAPVLNGTNTIDTVGDPFSTEYNIVPWTNLTPSTADGSEIITVKIPANSFIEKFTFEYYTTDSSRVISGKRYTNIPGFDIVKNDEKTPILLTTNPISDFVSDTEDTFTQSYSITLDTSVFRVPDANFSDYHYLQNRFNFSKNPDFDEAFSFFNPVMKKAKFFIQGVDLPNISSTTDGYYKYMVPYQKRLSRPVRNIYTYSFSINPINVNPSGSLDFSEIQSEKTKIELKLDPGLTDVYTLYIYYTGYQTFKFDQGFMSLVY